MSNEAEKTLEPPKQQQAQRDPVNTSDPKTNPPHENQSQVNRPQDISKKSPSQDSDSQNKGQQTPEGEKRRAS
ncbi:MAG: hypothetical protein WBZ01_00895 [Terriglobales bacterium]|jgi:hypothetical protein